jgi:hypothetical protein
MAARPNKPHADPVLLNRPGVLCMIVARTGRTARGTHREFYCRSSPVRVDSRIYPANKRVKFEAGVLWEITQSSPPPVPEGNGPWELTRQCRISVYDDAGKPTDVWPLLSDLIRKSFRSRSRVHLLLDIFPPPTRKTLDAASGIGRGSAQALNDLQVDELMNQHRMKKHGG